MNLNLNRIEFSSSSVQLRCPCCGEYYNFFCYPSFTVFFCCDTTQLLLEDVPYLCDSVRGFSAIYINCQTTKLEEAKFISN